MAQTISKSLGESLAGKGELYAALAYDATDKFGGMKIKALMLNSTGRISFLDANAYIYSSVTTQLDLVATTIKLTGAVTVDGDVTFLGDDTISVTLTDPTTAVNAIYGYIDAGGAWTAGNMVGLRGKVAISGGVAVCSATGVWAGVDIADAVSAKTGLVCALNAEVSSDNASKPNAIVYIQSLPGSGADFATVPYLVFSETAAGTGSNILFEVGHKEAATVPTLTSGTLFYEDTLQIAVNLTAGNRTAYYIPLSTVQGTFTTAYPIVSTQTAAAAIQLGTTGKVQFREAGIYISSSATTVLDIVTGGTLNLSGAVTANDVVTVTNTLGANENGVVIDLDAPLATVLHNWTAAQNITIDQTSAISGAWNATGRIMGVRSLVAFNNNITNVFGVYSKITAEAATASKTVNDVQAVVGVVDLLTTGGGTVTQQTTSMVCGLKGIIANTGTSCTWGGGCAVIAAEFGPNTTFTQGSALISAWNHGSTTVDQGLYLHPSGTLTVGISLEIESGGAFTLALGIGSTTPLTTATTAMRAVLVQSNFSGNGYHFGAQVISQYTLDGASYGSLRAIVGQVDLEATQTTVNTAQQIVGVHGRAKVSGTAYNSQLNICGVMAQLLDGGTWTAANLVYCLWVDNQLTTNPTAGKVAMIGIRQNNGVGTDVVDHVFDIYGAEIKQLFNFDSCISGGFIATSATAGTMTHTVKCLVDGASGYIHLYDQ